MKSVLRPVSVLFFLAVCLLSLAANAQITVQIGQNFTGTDNSLTLTTPADGNGAIGPNDFAEFINSSFAVYNKTNGHRRFKISDVKFWQNSGVIVDSGSEAVSDPRVIFDSLSQRWFASQVVFDKTAQADASDYFLLAVSDTTDPMGTWHGFEFLADPDNGYFADFPTLGVDSNAVYISGDMFLDSQTAAGPALTMIPKTNLLASPPTVANRIFFGDMDYSVRGVVLQPSSCFDASGSGNVIAAGDLGEDLGFHSNLVATTVLNAGKPTASLSSATSISVPAYLAPLNPTQPDGSISLDDNDARLSARTCTVRGIIYAVQNVEINDRAAIQWYRISATNHALLESGVIAEPDIELFFPSIAANTNGAVLIGCNGCGSSTFISSFAYAGVTANGVTTFGNRILLAAGDSDYHDLNDQTYMLSTDEWGESRWGDYSATSVDPTNPTHFWTIQMLPLYDPDYDITGGAAAFWKMQITELIVSTTQSPSLSISKSGSNVTVSWPVSASNYSLQSITNLLGTTWTAINSGLVTNSTAISYTTTGSTGQKFFRLQKN